MGGASAAAGGESASPNEDEKPPTASQQAEGLSLLRELAAQGCPEGQCGLAFCLLDGPGDLERDERTAALYFERAARAGLPQAMCELGTMFFLGDGVPEDEQMARVWFRRAAEAGVPAAMYLYAEILLTDRATGTANAWFAAAGRLGHRGARSRIVEAVADGGGGAQGEPGRYGRAAGRRAHQWVASAS